MDAFELLKKDHQKVSQLFSEIESANGQAKARLFGRLKSELDLHAHIEEAVLYPALENTDEAREITLEAYEEHKVVKDLLADLASAETRDDEWDAKLTVLKENVEHHVKEEEGELFDKARKALGDERIEALGVELEAEKARSTNSKPRSAAQTKKAAANKSVKSESAGVLQRLANLIGLGEAPASKSTSKKKPAASGGKAQSSRSASKSASKPSAAKSSKRISGGSKAARTPRKAASKKSATKSAAKARSSKKAAPARKSSSSSSARTSATKNASRAASNQKVNAASRGRKAAKSSTKTRSRSR